MNTKEFYQSKFSKYGFSPKSLLWKSKGAAHQRFRQFWSEIDFSNRSVLDVGCGFGELGKFLLKRYPGVDYTGIDIVPEFIDEAKRQVIGGRFDVADFMNPADGDAVLGRKYDVVIASGVLNGNHPKNLQFREDAITRLFNLSSKVLAFNMLGAHPQPKNEPNRNIWYADSIEILEFCLTLTRRVILRHHYNPKDFTMFMYKVSSKE